jgi:hypothetical protein
MLNVTPNLGSGYPDPDLPLQGYYVSVAQKKCTEVPILLEEVIFTFANSRTRCTK